MSTQCPPPSDVALALQAAAQEANWGRPRIAFVAGVTEAALRKFFSGETRSLRGDSVIALMRDMPGFAARLGFKLAGNRKAA